MKDVQEARDEDAMEAMQESQNSAANVLLALKQYLHLFECLNQFIKPFTG